MSGVVQAAQDSPRIQPMRNSMPVIPSLFDDDILRTTVGESEKVSLDFSPIRLEVCDSKMRCLPNSPVLHNTINPESSYCDNTYSIGPPTTIYGNFSKDEISLLSSDDHLNEASDNHFLQYICHDLASMRTACD
jgi:hypothetical protein